MLLIAALPSPSAGPGPGRCDRPCAEGTKRGSYSRGHGHSVRWGIIGTGGIARAFVHGPGRGAGRPGWWPSGRASQASADRFGDANGVPRRHASYEALAEDPEVDVVYVATPHPLHAENALAAIAAGKHVLVEKAFTMDAAEAAAVVDAARAAGVFCMEAMWTRFLPNTVRVRELIAAGAIGEVRTVVADHGQFFAPDPAAPAVRARAGRRGPARPRHLSRVVRVDGARRAGVDHRGRRPGVHGRRRPDVGDPARRRRARMLSSRAPCGRRRRAGR